MLELVDQDADTSAPAIPFTRKANGRFTQDDIDTLEAYVRKFDEVGTKDDFPTRKSNETARTAERILGAVGYNNANPMDILALYYICTHHRIYRHMTVGVTIDSVLATTRQLREALRYLSWERMLDTFITADEWVQFEEMTYRDYYEVVREVSEMFRREVKPPIHRYTEMWHSGIREYSKMYGFVQNDIDPHLAHALG